jgi:hypothetical protein
MLVKIPVTIAQSNKVLPVLRTKTMALLAAGMGGEGSVCTVCEDASELRGAWQLILTWNGRISRTSINLLRSKNEKSLRLLGGLSQLLSDETTRKLVGDGDHVDAAAFTVKLHFAIAESEKRVVFAAAYVDTWMNFGAALADDDVAGDNDLSAKFFHSETIAA